MLEKEYLVYCKEGECIIIIIIIIIIIVRRVNLSNYPEAWFEHYKENIGSVI